MPNPAQTHFRMFALYNNWANDCLYQAAAALPDAELRQDRGAFFKSVLGTLNHLLVTDRIWMARLEGNSPHAYRLDQILHENLAELTSARQQENQRITAYVFALEETAFAEMLDYQTSTGATYRQPVAQILAHLLNHQTHHRAQAHTLITQIAGPERTPPLDMLIYQRFVEKSKEI